MEKLTRMNQEIQQNTQFENARRAQERREEAEHNLTPAQRRKREERQQEEKQRVEEITARVNKEKQQALEIVNSFFDSNKEEFNQFIDDTHNLEESPVNALVDGGGDPHSNTGHFECKLCEDSNVLLFRIPSFRDERAHWSKVCYVMSQFEEHCKYVEPEQHREELLRIIDSEYSDTLRAELRKKQPTFEEELEQISKIKSAPAGYPQIRKRKPREKTAEEKLREFDAEL